ncbi:MAG: FkbM family methyltransferase [Saprospiraceae bacterium]|nr:FkbM family methyltransferase [Saprospiraceae bacterium]
MNQHSFVIALKKIFFSKGEPYLFNGKNLKFLPGTRPCLRKYIGSNSDVVRNDILQIEYFEMNFTPQDILWDIGSHYGHYSIFAASIVNEANRVFSFEPDKDAMTIQRRNIALNGFKNKIKPFDLAVSNITGNLQFNALDGNANSHIVKVADAAHVNMLTVKSKTINDLLEEIP